MTQLFGSILNWKLKHGSHEFPGPDGGTCINEAAVVAAGFPYRSITTVEELPDCFSRVIGQYALTLNDVMPTRARQKILLPFVLRMANTRDTMDIEDARYDHIVFNTKYDILQSYFPAPVRMPDRMSLVQLLEFATQSAVERRNYLDAHHLDYVVKIAKQKPNHEDHAVCDIALAAHAAAAVAKIVRNPVYVFEKCAKILDSAILMGNHNPVGCDLGVARMDNVRKSAIRGEIDGEATQSESKATAESEAA